MQYEDGYGSSLKCGYGTYTVKSDSSVEVKDCELVNGEYKCQSGVISIENPNSSPVLGRTWYAALDERKFCYFSE